MALEDILSSPGDSMNTSACSRGNIGDLVDITVIGQECSRLYLVIPTGTDVKRGISYGRQNETIGTRRFTRNIGV